MTQDTQSVSGHSLLETIMADPQLVQRATQSKSISLTITLEVDPAGQARIDHSPWRDASESASERPQPTTTHPTGEGDEGFVPSRAVVEPGQRSAAATEYRLIGSLGSGGTGIVYQAHQRGVDREVAVKVLRDELADDPLARQRFLLEARTIGGLDHPNVIALHELATGPRGQLFYSMKRIDGTSWDRTMDEMSFEENLSTLARLCDAIRYAHSRDLIHRDIKPENVMLGRFGEVLLADWGLALALDDTGRGRHTVGAIGGTPAYMAPELAAGDAAAQSIRTDIYLLGALLYRILTGQPPHDGENLLDCLRAAASNRIRPTTVQGGWIEVALRAMATRPEDRYRDVAELAEALAKEKDHERSSDLLRRAQRLIGKAGPAAKHQDYSIAEALVRESLDAWPGNRQAAESLVQLQTEHARFASAAGDFDLALHLLAQAGLGDSEMAARVRAKRASRREQAVRESKFSQLFIHSPDAGLMTRWDDGEITEANLMFEHLTGYQPAAVVGKKILDMNLWHQNADRDRFVETLAERGAVADFEATMLHRDGTPLAVSLSANKVQLGGEAFILTSLRDIGPRVRARQQLQDCHRQLRQLQRLAKVDCWSFDLLNQVVSWTDSSIAGGDEPLTHQAAKLETFLQSFDEQDRPSLGQKLHEAIRRCRPFQLRIRRRTADGRLRAMLIRGEPDNDSPAALTAVRGVIVDLSDYFDPEASAEG